jgi:hypothetical protein
VGRSSSAWLIEHERVRKVNDRIRTVAESSRLDAPTLFICECGRRGCTETIELELEEFEAIRWREHVYVVAPGHERADRDRVLEEHDGFELVTEHGGTRARPARSTI